MFSCVNSTVQILSNFISLSKQQGYDDMVKKHVKIVDDTPHAALLYGGDPDKDTRPGFLKVLAKDLPRKQEIALNFWLNSHQVEDDLKPLYEAKLNKNKLVQKTTQTQPEVLRKAIELTRQFLKVLELDLTASGGPWICGKVLTMADIAWHVSLVRFITFGCHYLYQDLPNVAMYLKIVVSQKALKSATFSWPGYFPSPNLTSILKSEVSMWAAEKNQLKIVLLSYFAGFGLGTFELAKYSFTGKIPQTMIVLIGLWIGSKSGIYKNAIKTSLTNVMVYFKQRILK